MLEVGDIITCKKVYNYDGESISKIGNKYRIVNFNLFDGIDDICNIQCLKDSEHLFFMYIHENFNGEMLINGSYILEYFDTKQRRARKIIKKYVERR